MLSLAVYCTLPETSKSLNAQALRLDTMLTNYKVLLCDRLFVGNLLASSLAISTIIVYASLSPFILQNTYHLSSVHFGWSMAAVSVMAIVSRYFNIVLLKRYTRNQIITAGLSIMSAGSLIMLALSIVGVHSIYVIIFPAMVVITGSGLVPSNAMVNVFVRFKDRSASVSALYGSLVMFGGFVATGITSWVANTTYFMSMILFGISLVPLVFFLWALWLENMSGDVQVAG